MCIRDSPRTRRAIQQLNTTAASRAIQQLNTTAASHAAAWTDVCTVPGLEPCDVTGGQRGPSDCPWDQQPACEAERTGARAAEQR
eukprot:4255514-Alexandrium_andersonii.AAC.1